MPQLSNHKTESTCKLPAVPLERLIQSQDRSWQPQVGSLSHHVDGYYPKGPQMGTSLQGLALVKVFLHLVSKMTVGMC